MEPLWIYSAVWTMKTVDVENTRFLYFTGKKVYENCTDKYRCQIYCQLYTRQNVEIFLLRLFVFLSNISTYAFAKLAALDYKVIREMNVQKNIYINIFRSIIVILEYTESKFHRITELRLVWAINVHTAKKKKPKFIYCCIRWQVSNKRCNEVVGTMPNVCLLHSSIEVLNWFVTSALLHPAWCASLSCIVRWNQRSWAIDTIIYKVNKLDNLCSWSSTF